MADELTVAEPRVQLANPGTPAARVHPGLHFSWPEGGRWNRIEVRRDAGTCYLTAWNIAEAMTPLTLSGDLADIEANVGDLVRALATFQAELAPAPEAGP